MYCKHCGEKIKEDSSFCEHCGQKLGNTEDMIEEKQKPKAVASTTKRLLNFFLDWGFMCLFAFVVGLFAELFGLWSILENWGDTVFGIMIMATYYITFEGIFNKSVAKFITRTKVVRMDGSKPSFGTILLRTVCRFIPFEILSFFGSNPIGWHDRLSGTIVINIKK